MARIYNSEEVERIIRRAQQQKMSDHVSHDELLRMAEELGIDPHNLEAAAAAEGDEQRLAEEHAAKLKKRQEGFKTHLWTFLIMIVFFFVLNLFTRGPFWFQWPLIGWGLAVAFHYRSAYFPTDEDLANDK
jgi:hypothetical protein